MKQCQKLIKYVAILIPMDNNNAKICSQLRACGQGAESLIWNAITCICAIHNSQPQHQA